MTGIPLLRKSMLLIAATVSLSIGACRKEAISTTTNQVQNNHISFLWSDLNRIRVNQAVAIYDSTFIRDSIDFVHPPGNRYYDWEVIPDTGCDSVMSNKGFSSIVFTCSGTYQITAKIYDSLTNELVATTDTLSVNVTTDTLFRSQPIKADDILKIQTGLSRSHSDSLGDAVTVFLRMQTTSSYNYPHLELHYTKNILPGSYNYLFSNEIILRSYPFAAGPYDYSSTLPGWIDLEGLTYGIPATLNITWLGNTYSGTVTLLDEDHYTFTWDNSGAVHME